MEDHVCFVCDREVIAKPCTNMIIPRDRKKRQAFLAWVAGLGK